jgi:hypothetical protein
MTTVEQLNSAIERYLRISTTRYLELGAYETASEMLDEFEYECVYNFIEYELIFKIGYCWSDNIYDIGMWQTDPMFRLMYNTIINNPTLILHMTNFINTERTVVGITITLTDYSPLNVLRHYVFYYARKLDKSFFMQLFVEYFQDIQSQRQSSLSIQNSHDNDNDLEPANDTPIRIPPPA